MAASLKIFQIMNKINLNLTFIWKIGFKIIFISFERSIMILFWINFVKVLIGFKKINKSYYINFYISLLKKLFYEVSSFSWKTLSWEANRMYNFEMFNDCKYIGSFWFTCWLCSNNCYIYIKFKIRSLLYLYINE